MDFSTMLTAICSRWNQAEVSTLARIEDLVTNALRSITDFSTAWEIHLRAVCASAVADIETLHIMEVSYDSPRV